MKRITIYALSTCLWCKKTKKYFEEKKLPFDCIDYDKQDEAGQERIMAEIREHGGAGTFPFVKIGNACTQGFNPEKFEELLEKK